MLGTHFFVVYRFSSRSIKGFGSWFLVSCFIVSTLGEQNKERQIMQWYKILYFWNVSFQWHSLVSDQTTWSHIHWTWNW